MPCSLLPRWPSTPVSAEGVAIDAFGAAADSRLVTQSQLTHASQNGAAERGADHSAMDEIAKDTGGVALYGTNSLVGRARPGYGPRNEFLYLDLYLDQPGRKRPIS